MTRLAWGAALAAVLLGPVIFTLTAHVEDLRDAPLARDRAGWTPMPVPLEPSGGEPTVLRLALYTRDLHAVLSRPEIDVAFATYGPTVELVRGMLYARACTYATPDGTRVEDNSHVRFLRARDCDPGEPPQPGLAAVERIELVMHVRAPRPLLVWTFAPSTPATDPDLIFVGASPDGGAVVPVLRGRYVDVRAPSSARRQSLLAYAWQLWDQPYWIAVAVALAGLLFAAGGSAVAATRARDDTRARRVSNAAGAAAMALGLGLLYAVLVPPFQAPSEPDHLLAFADLAGRADLADEAAHWARLGHLERIKFHTAERLRPVDMGRPYAEAWSEGVFPMRMGGRSRVTELCWLAVAPALEGRSAPVVLLLLRLFNVVVFALALGAGAALLGTTRQQYAVITAVGLLLVPTLPFFAMHVSDFAVLTSLYVVFACLVAALFLDSAGSHRLGLPLGVLCALMLAGGRSTAPVMALAAAAFVGRALVGSSGQASARGALRSAAVFWLGAALGTTLLAASWSGEYGRSLFPGDASGVPEWFRIAAEAIRNKPWWLPALLPAGILVEMGFAGVRMRLRPAPGRVRGRIVTAAGYGAALAIVGIAVASAFVKMPTLDTFEPGNRPPLERVAGQAVAAALTGVRLTNPDYLTSTTFWGGYGWLDAVLPAAVVTMVVCVFGGLLVITLWGVGRRGDERRFVLLAVIWAGAVAGLLGATAATYFLNRNVHGRYLVGLYLTGIAVVWAGAALMLERGERRGATLARLAASGLPLACALVHGYALAFILKRYF